MTGIRASLLLLGCAVVLPAPARADMVIADLSSHSIGITTGFTGASVVLRRVLRNRRIGRASLYVLDIPIVTIG